MAIKITEQGVRMGEVAQREYNREAAEDLERIEEAVKKEAEQYVEAVDGDGSEQKAVEAAGTAFDFDEAVHETEDIAEKSYEDTDDPRFGPYGW